MCEAEQIVSAFAVSINEQIYGLTKFTAEGRAGVAFGTREDAGGRKERESENKDRGGTSEHFEFVVEWGNCLKSGTKACSTAEFYQQCCAFYYLYIFQGPRNLFTNPMSGEAPKRSLSCNLLQVVNCNLGSCDRTPEFHVKCLIPIRRKIRIGLRSIRRKFWKMPELNIRI